jgi:di/tricarboxylate transporter
VSVGVARLLVGHRALTRATATRLFIVHVFATTMGVLTLLLGLAAGHLAFTTMSHVAASGRILFVILRGTEGNGGRRDRQGSGANEGDYECFHLLHLYVS